MSPPPASRRRLRLRNASVSTRERLMFEFTEDERVTDQRHLKRIVEEYRRFGFTTAMDDFGAGYAGLNLLADLQPDVIKLDMALIRNIHLNPARQTILAGLVFIARTMGVAILAEGVESREEMIVLRAAGVRLFQGYLFAKTHHRTPARGRSESAQFRRGGVGEPPIGLKLAATSATPDGDPTGTVASMCSIVTGSQSRYLGFARREDTLEHAIMKSYT